MSAQSRNPTQAKRHWPALDGLRAVAVLAVMIYHLTQGHLGNFDVLPGGYLGVDVFFVLSGFLITSLLISEWDTHGQKVSFRNFYARRVLRLFPALACVVAFATAVAWYLESARIGGSLYGPATFRALPWVAVFLGNWSEALGAGYLGLLSHTWSLAVEEQFYLLWPGLFVLLSRRSIGRERLALWLAVTAVSQMLYRQITDVSHVYTHARIYFGTDTHSDGLIIGCSLAFWLTSRSSAGKALAGSAPFKAISWAAVVILIALFCFGWSPSGSIPVAVLCTAVVLAGVVQGKVSGTLERVLSSRPMVWIGRRSYGLYLWHFTIYMTLWLLYSRYLYFLANAGVGGWTGTGVVDAAAILVSLAVTALSYRFIELPALRLKKRYRGTAGRPRTSVGTERAPVPELPVSGAGGETHR